MFLTRYTYGKGVDGVATITVSNPSMTYWGWDSVSRKRLEPRTVEIKDLTVSSADKLQFSVGIKSKT